MDRIRQLTKDIRLKHLIIDQYIPAAEYMKVERRAIWDNKQWTIPKMEFTGNYIKKNKEKKKKGQEIDADADSKFLYEHILDFDDEEEEEDFKQAATDRVQSMINNIVHEEGEEEVPIVQTNTNVYYKYTDQGAEREDPEALTKKKDKKKDKRKQSAKRPLTAKKMKKGDIVSMVETITNSQSVNEQEAKAKKKQMNFPKAKGLVKE